MNDDNCPFLRGFDQVARETNEALDKNFKSALKLLSLDLLNDKKSAENVAKNLVLTMDNDSGYVSHNHESNLDTSVESSFQNNCDLNNKKTIYLSEDALMEKPECSSSTGGQSPDIITASVSSVKTNFSGFESDSGNESFVIDHSKPIIFDSKTANSSDLEKSSIGEKTIATPQKQVKNANKSTCVSPDLFSDDEPPEQPARNLSVENKKFAASQRIKIDENTRKDLMLLKNLHTGLTGVFPPPSVTTIQMSVSEMLEKIAGNKKYFWKSTATCQKKPKSLLIDGPINEAINKPWPQILKARNHGLHYNNGQYSEQFELLCGKYGERHVGAETQSSCTSFETAIASPSKRKNIKNRWTAKSPGRRLSHLARRRITFSRDNLQNVGNAAIIGSRTRQILVDAKKISQLNRRKSPRKTPSKSPFGKRKTTPSSSAKKRMIFKCRQMSSEAAQTTEMQAMSFKRALFQSPEKIEQTVIAGPSSLLAKRGTKRALFTSPCKKSPLKKSPYKIEMVDKKRKLNLENENPMSKLSRSVSLDYRQQDMSKVLNRTKSDSSIMKLNSTLTEELSEIHKKKLQWAVYEALRLQNINSSHPKFKIFASILARVTRRFLPNLSANVPRPEEGTSERMLRIARHHSYAAVKGKSVDEIINEHVRNRAKNQKLHGYIGIEEYNNMKNNKENVLQDKVNTMESIEKKKLEALGKPKNSNEKLDRIRKVISFDDGGTNR